MSDYEYVIVKKKLNPDKYRYCLICKKDMWDNYPCYKIYYKEEGYQLGKVRGTLCQDCYNSLSVNKGEEEKE